MHKVLGENESKSADVEGNGSVLGEHCSGPEGGERGLRRTQAERIRGGEAEPVQGTLCGVAEGYVNGRPSRR